MNAFGNKKVLRRETCAGGAARGPADVQAHRNLERTFLYLEISLTSRATDLSFIILPLKLLRNRYYRHIIFIYPGINTTTQNELRVPRKIAIIIQIAISQKWVSKAQRGQVRFEGPSFSAVDDRC